MAVPDRFWSFDGESFETHKTASHAENECTRTIEAYDSDAEVVPDIDQMCWGTITEAIVETNHLTHSRFCVRDNEPGERGCVELCDIRGDERDEVYLYKMQRVTKGDDYSKLKTALLHLDHITDTEVEITHGSGYPLEVRAWLLEAQIALDELTRNAQ